LFLIFSIAQFDGPNNEITSHPIVIILHSVSPSYIILLRPTFSWLLCLSLQWQPSKPNALSDNNTTTNTTTIKTGNTEGE
jgi:hypothetical protein